MVLASLVGPATTAFWGMVIYREASKFDDSLGSAFQRLGDTLDKTADNIEHKFDTRASIFLQNIAKSQCKHDTARPGTEKALASAKGSGKDCAGY